MYDIEAGFMKPADDGTVFEILSIIQIKFIFAAQLLINQNSTKEIIYEEDCFSFTSLHAVGNSNRSITNQG
jgi:hypothetical protein